MLNWSGAREWNFPLGSLAYSLSLPSSLRNQMDRIEAWLIRRALERHGHRRTATARTLGVTREGLYKKMKRLGIE